MNRAAIVAVVGVVLFVLILVAAAAIKQAELALVSSSGGGGGSPPTSCWPAPGDKNPVSIKVTLDGYDFYFHRGRFDERNPSVGRWSSGEIIAPGSGNNGIHTQTIVEVATGEGHGHPTPLTPPPPPPVVTAPDVHALAGVNGSIFDIHITFLANNRVRVRGKVQGNTVDETVTKTRKNLGKGQWQNSFTAGGTVVTWRFP